MQRRIIILTIISVGVLLATVGVLSYVSVKNSIDRSLDDRLQLTSIIANYVDTLLQSDITRLYDISLSGAVDFTDNDWSQEKDALEIAYQYSLFKDGIFLVDLNGDVVLDYPPGRGRVNMMSLPFIRQALDSRKMIVSDVYTVKSTQRRLIYVLVPLTDRNGELVGLAGGEIDPTSYSLTRILKTIPTHDETYVELVDSQGTIIASNNPSRLFGCTDHNKLLNNLIKDKAFAVTACHRCHAGEGPTPDLQRTTDMLAFAPLSEAPWGVSIREPKDMVFAPATELGEKFIILACMAMISALVFAIGISKGIVKPVHQLIDVTQRLAAGNLREPINIMARDELNLLNDSVERMRVKLLESVEEIQHINEDLEDRVVERTSELRLNRERLATLLKEVIRAQEAERKRIARELHDETSQSLAALGMSVDIAGMAFQAGKLDADGIQSLRLKVNQILEGISLLIRDLRPPILDDLGLESAIKWLLKRHMGERDIAYFLSMTPEFEELMAGRLRLAPDSRKTELVLFRVTQEAVVNITKYAEASHVQVSLDADESRIYVTVEDNGRGFDAKATLALADTGRNTGFGLLGMRERVSLLGGELTIESEKGCGTKVSFQVPLM